MKPSNILASKELADNVLLECVEHDGDLSLHLNRQPFASTRAHEPETMLARRGCSRIRRYRNPVVVIGGLGLGFVLQEALRVTPDKTTIVVVEPMDVIVQWNQTLLGPEAAGALRDPRVRVEKKKGMQAVLKALPRKADALLLAWESGLHAAPGEAPFSRNQLQGCVQGLNPRGSINVRTARSDAGRIASILTACRLTTVTYATAARSGGRSRTHAVVSGAKRQELLPEEDAL